MSQFVPSIRDRLEQIAAQAATAAEALADSAAIDLDTRRYAELLFALDCAAGKVASVVECLGSAMDPGRLVS
jgi:hypothetical protein